jgi:DNA-binding transcriptional regulator GbsR (MarR family)
MCKNRYLYHKILCFLAAGRANYLNASFEWNAVKDREALKLKKPVIEACIKSARKYGKSDAIGLLRGTLFLESEPMSLDMLAESTGYSKTTVRSSMNLLENLGIARRVVDPQDMHHNIKQHRYALVNDAEAKRQVILSAAKEEVDLILQALLQVRDNLEREENEGCNRARDKGYKREKDEGYKKEEKLKALLAESLQFYEEMKRTLDLISRFTSKELIEILEEHDR